MKAILTKGKRTVAGKVVQNGLGVITLAVIDKSGSINIKRFKKDLWNVRLIEEAEK